MQELVIPELLSNAWNLMKSRLWPLIAVAAIGAAPSWIAQIIEAALGFPVTLFAIPITGVISVISYGAGLAIAHAYLFRSENWGAAEGFGFAFSKVGPLLGVAILQGLVTGIGVCFCILPGIFAFVVLCAAVPLVLFDDAPVLESFSQSYALTRGSWLEIFVVFLAAILILLLPMILGVCIFGAGLGIAANAGGEPGPAASGWATVLFSLVLAPITLAGSAFFNSLYIVVYRALLRRQGRTDEQVVEVFA